MLVQLVTGMILVLDLIMRNLYQLMRFIENIQINFELTFKETDGRLVLDSLKKLKKRGKILFFSCWYFDCSMPIRLLLLLLKV